MTLPEVVRVVLAEALAARVHPVTVTVGRYRVDLVVRDHRVTVECAALPESRQS